MALVKCPECGKEVSDQSKVCIHCGYPFDTSLDLKKIDFVFNPNINQVKKIGMVRDTLHCDLWKAKEIVLKYSPTPPEPKNVPKCPKCGSTSITAGQRGYSLFSGFIGSSKTVNRCANCGYKWNPGK